MRIEVVPSARDELANLCERRGMTQVAVVSRAVEWLTNQSEVVQAAILGIYPGDMRSKVAEIILQDLVKTRKKKS